MAQKRARRWNLGYLRTRMRVGPRARPFIALVLAAAGVFGCRAEVVNSLELLPDCPGAGMALSFDGMTGQKVFADIGGALPIGSAPRTVEMWAYSRVDGWGVNRYTLFEYGYREPRQAFGIDMDVFPTMQVYSWDDDIFFDSGLPRQGWFHIAATYDGALTIKAFVNGREMKVAGREGPAVIRDNILPLGTVASEVRIGWADNTEPDAYFNGQIDEVRIWNVARSAADIQQTMSVRLTGSEPGLVAYWRFDEMTGDVAVDSSLQHHDAVLMLEPRREPSAAPIQCAK
jgi:Concanavalin A-like lectin/glucanases superfamily